MALGKRYGRRTHRGCEGIPRYESMICHLLATLQLWKLLARDGCVYATGSSSCRVSSAQSDMMQHRLHPLEAALRLMCGRRCGWVRGSSGVCRSRDLGWPVAASLGRWTGRRGANVNFLQASDMDMLPTRIRSATATRNGHVYPTSCSLPSRTGSLFLAGSVAWWLRALHLSNTGPSPNRQRHA